ncbi:radical SAM family heme chaperone HemW [Granulicella sp. dw_53]|uniref:radical SAM family heme chaperone HemW n=1 Tax=Granulicella sp. dw_53 TaxID=2719792 RepID=UPI001BD52BCA|nr:radical SAM family heme chaperone HemW [Granulicella sp. dw_53]
MTTPLGVYISIPFCKAKCTFCNFASGAFAPSRMQRYIDRLCQEIASTRATALRLEAQLPQPQQIDTLYLGGGTPSLLSPDHLRQLFTTLRSEFTFSPDAEITLECAPGQLSGETLAELLRQGMNRISLGVQSFVDRESAAVGRLHTEQICLDEIARLRAAGLEDINLDLIVGLPHQTESSWQHSLAAAIAIGAPHVSVYMLEVDDESRLGREMLAKGSRYSASSVPSEDAAADWYQLACDRLNASGLHQYEISNFARPGHRSRHNLKYWNRDPYLGFGLDAHSMLLTPTGAVRFANTSDLDLYSADSEASPSPLPIYTQATPETLPPPEIDLVSSDQAFEESLFLGLRLNDGINLNTLRDHFGEALLHQTLPALHDVHEAGLLHLTSDRIALTDRGRMVSNEVFSRLLLTTPT